MAISIMPPSALCRFTDAFGIPVVETYGMTEAASMITAKPLNGPRKVGSADCRATSGRLRSAWSKSFRWGERAR
jgi:acyl-coenzyme A synthetase/AMP-(fatty) acid ligase